MTLQLTANSFLQVLTRSQLLTATQLQAVAARCSASEPGGAPAADIADWLVQQQALTRWQADKLLQAKYRGFFLGPYRLEYKVARGGMSTIYAARNCDTGELCALKVLPVSRINKSSYLPRFYREAEIACRLQHPHIVRVYGVHAESDGRHTVHFMAMELLHGRDLFAIVQSEGPLPVRRAAEYICQAATGLQYAHAAGLVHRDIKPGNLFLADDNRIRILDLGLASDFESEESLTREYNERVLGTADYLAPEQAVDSHTADVRADIYSLGCTFYFLLTGKPPFSEGTLLQRVVAHQKQPVVPVTSLRGDVPEVVAALLSEMLQKKREDRVQSAQEVADRLMAWLQQVEPGTAGLPAAAATSPDAATDHSALTAPGRSIPAAETPTAPVCQQKTAGPCEAAAAGVAHSDPAHPGTVVPENIPQPQVMDLPRVEAGPITAHSRSGAESMDRTAAEQVPLPPHVDAGAAGQAGTYLAELEHFLHFLEQDDGQLSVLDAPSEISGGGSAFSQSAVPSPVAVPWLKSSEAWSPGAAAGYFDGQADRSRPQLPAHTPPDDSSSSVHPLEAAGRIQLPRSAAASPADSAVAVRGPAYWLLLLLALCMFPAGMLTAVIWPQLVPALQHWLEAVYRWW